MNKPGNFANDTIENYFKLLKLGSSAKKSDIEANEKDLKELIEFVSKPKIVNLPKEEGINCLAATLSRELKKFFEKRNPDQYDFEFKNKTLMKYFQENQIAEIVRKVTSEKITEYARNYE